MKQVSHVNLIVHALFLEVSKLPAELLGLLRGFQTLVSQYDEVHKSRCLEPQSTPYRQIVQQMSYQKSLVFTLRRTTTGEMIGEEIAFQGNADCISPKVYESELPCLPWHNKALIKKIALKKPRLLENSQPVSWKLPSVSHTTFSRIIFQV